MKKHEDIELRKLSVFFKPIFIGTFIAKNEEEAIEKSHKNDDRIGIRICKEVIV